VTAAQQTVRETDARMRNGNLITGSEGELLAGDWTVNVPSENLELPLTISGVGNTVSGTFDGEPIDVSVTGRNLEFTAPVMVDGREYELDFAGTFENDRISNGVAEAQGDGVTLDWNATRD
jgi:hypothetical protein